MKALMKLTIALLILLPAGIPAQEVSLVGQRVRLHPRGGSVITGQVTSATAGEIRLLVEGSDSEVEFHRSSITGLEKSLGEHRKFAKVLFMSVGATAALTGAVSAISWKPCRDTGFMACLLHPESRGAAFSWGAVGGAVIGLPIGIVLGLTMKSEKWASVKPDAFQDMSISILPILGNRPGVGASLSLGLF